MRQVNAFLGPFFFVLFAIFLPLQIYFKKWENIRLGQGQTLRNLYDKVLEAPENKFKIFHNRKNLEINRRNCPFKLKN